VLAALRQRFTTWASRRQRYDHGTVTLAQRSIYILPTRTGIGFAFVLGLMLLGDINYNLSLGYVLTFLLGTMGMMSMLHAFRNMAQLQVRAGHTDAVFAGNTAQFAFHFRNNGSLPRYRLNLHDEHAHSTVFDIPAQQSMKVLLAVPAPKRGWQGTGRLTLDTEFPLGLFHAWSYLEFDTRCVVYPRPADPIPLPASSAQNGSGASSAAGDEDFAGLRGYVAGDALQRIAWKALAREQGLQIKQFSALQGIELWLDWNLAPAPGVEQKLEILTRWVLDAEAQGVHYGLRLPNLELPLQHGEARPSGAGEAAGQLFPQSAGFASNVSQLPPGQGSSHRDECLRALALYGLGAAREQAWQ
jgi:uncharacterized protein (DUF58 family)